LLYTLAKKDKEGGDMKFYMASYNGSVADGMNYKEQGSGNDFSQTKFLLVVEGKNEKHKFKRIYHGH
jgi:hypothetical protein